VVAGSKVYFGSEDGWLYALSVERGRILWRVRADGALKAAAALATSRLFIGSYGGSFYAVDDSGRIL
jgi:outer membrane protein assembly factor BamB